MQYYFFIRENLKRKKKGFEKENRIIFLFEKWIHVTKKVENPCYKGMFDKEISEKEI